MFPVMFMIPRVVGWLAHWNEFMSQKEKKITRPRQNYTGYSTRKYVPMGERPETQFVLSCSKTENSKRNDISEAYK